MKQIISIFSIFLFLSSQAIASTESPDTLILKANAAYNQEKYEEAINLYQSVVSEGYESEILYYNFGNAYFRNGNITYAILFYEKALLINPGNEQAKHNLEIANAQIKDKIDEIPQFFIQEYINIIKKIFSSDIWALFSIISLAISLFGIAIFLFTRKIVLRKIMFFVALFFFLLLIVDIWASYSLKQEHQNHKTAIVTNPAITIKSSPNKSGTDLFLLHEGTKVRIVNEKIPMKTNSVGNKEGWYEIKLADGKIGWLPADAIEKI